MTMRWRGRSAGTSGKFLGGGRGASPNQFCVAAKVVRTVLCAESLFSGWSCYNVRAAQGTVRSTTKNGLEILDYFFFAFDSAWENQSLLGAELGLKLPGRLPWLR